MAAESSTNLFFHDYQRRTFNGDAEVSCVDDATGELVFDANGRRLHLGQCSGSAVGFLDSAGNPLAGTLERTAEGEQRTTKTHTQDWGATLQLSHKSSIFGHRNQATARVAYDGHSSRFTQREAEADFVPSGNSVGTVRTGPFETQLDVRTRQHNVGVYATDTFDITERLALTLAGRYQHVRIAIRDRSGQNPALDGDHRFSRFSPSAGLAFQVVPNMNLFGSYGEGFRAPTAAELTCADPNAPCNLPNAFVADPPLKPVIARTYEVGVRGKVLGKALEWNVGLFRTDLEDDILFTVVETGGGGFFQNVSQTRRQGVEAGLFGRVEGADILRELHAHGSDLPNPHDAGECDRGRRGRPGDRIPGIPAHSLKVGAEVAILNNFWVGGDVIVTSASFLRGDDANRQSKLDGYAILNLHARYEPIKHVELWARLDNVTNEKYESAGALNFNAFADPIRVERFVAPGPPFAGYAGVRVRFQWLTGRWRGRHATRKERARPSKSVKAGSGSRRHERAQRQKREIPGATEHGPARITAPAAGQPAEAPAVQRDHDESSARNSDRLGQSGRRSSETPT
jgi:outer membrane receptor protein involved in Fe transport